MSPRGSIYARYLVHAPFYTYARLKETSKDKVVLLRLRIKQRCLCLYDYKYCLHYTLYLMEMSVACNLIPLGDRLDGDPTVDFLDKDAVGLNGLCSLS